MFRGTRVKSSDFFIFRSCTVMQVLLFQGSTYLMMHYTGKCCAVKPLCVLPKWGDTVKKQVWLTTFCRES